MRILLFGRNGQVGRELMRTLPMLGEVVAMGQVDADFRDLAHLREVLYSHAPDVIVNAAAYTAVDEAESDEATAMVINAKAPGVMADYARYNGSLLVHFSTDYIFDGVKDGPYIETDRANPLNAYGRTKLAGEEAIMQGGCHYLIFRTSWVYSAHGNNFIKTILHFAKERNSLNVVDDQVGAPTSAELIADVTAISIAAYFAELLPEGVFHLTASGTTSWHGLASYALQKAAENGLRFKLAPERIYPTTTEASSAPAKRPKNSALDTKKLSDRLGFAMPEWQHHVDRMIDQFVSQEQ